MYSTCRAPVANKTFPDPSDAKFKCQHYKQKGTDTDKHYCISCQHGYTSAVKKDSDNQSYLECDKEIVGCSNNKVGGFLVNKRSVLGHGFNSSAFYSCHQCASGYIPFLFAPLTSNKV